MEPDDIPECIRGLAFEFFVRFSHFEYALKEKNFCAAEDRDAKLNGETTLPPIGIALCGISKRGTN
jgi:hypothetical protein